MVTGGVERDGGLSEYVLLLPRLVRLVARLMRDERVPPKLKAKLVFVGVYLVSPIDLIPAFVPGIGQLDDLVLLALALDGLLNHVPEEVVREHWEGAEDVLEVVREVLRQFTGRVPWPLRRMLAS